jgi:hypothetical protein
LRWHARAPPLRASSAWGTTEPQRHRCGHAEIGRATTNAAMTKCIVHSAASSLGNISALPPSFVGQPRHAPCALCQQTIMRGSDQSAVLAGPQRAYTTFRTRAVQPPSLRPCGNRCEQTQKTCSVPHTRFDVSTHYRSYTSTRLHASGLVARRHPARPQTVREVSRERSD